MKKKTSAASQSLRLRLYHLFEPWWVKLVLFALLVAAMVVFPGIVSLYLQRIVIMIGFYLMLALSLNFITGYLGQVSLGHAAFYAIGAYTSVLLTTFQGMDFMLSALVGACVSALFGLLLACATMRLQGTYLAIVTMAFFYVIMGIILNWDSLTQGAAGVRNIPSPTFFGLKLTLQNGGIFYLLMAFVMLTILVTHLIINSKVGRAIKAVRDDELAASMMGINQFQSKIIAYMMGAFFAGLAGALYGAFMGYINNLTFTYDMCIMTLTIVILGGMGSTKGMIIGAVIISPLGELLRAATGLLESLSITDPEQWRFVIYGIILVLMMHFRPQGILGGQSRLPYKMPKGVKRRGASDGAA